MKAKHTPTPWAYTRTHTCSQDAWYVITDADGWGPIVDVGGHDKEGQIAEAKYMATDPEIVTANAAFIVTACNSHDRLLAALKKCRDVLDDVRLDHQRYPLWIFDQMEAIALADAAIALAEKI